MGRYDEDARLRNEELARLRAQLDASTASPSSRSSPSPIRRKPAEIATLNPSDGDEEADSPSVQQPGVASTGQIGLRARRNLTLGVSTDHSSGATVPAAAVTPVDVVAPAVPAALAAKLDSGPLRAFQGSALQIGSRSEGLSDRFTRPASCTSALGGPARMLTLRPKLSDGMLEPMTDCRHNVRTWGGLGTDARSLWRRRQNEVAEKASQIEAGETPEVETPKLYRLDHSVPDSPKRLPPASARRARRETWCVPTIAEDELVEPELWSRNVSAPDHTHAAEPELVAAEPLEALDEKEEPGSEQAGLAASKNFAERRKKKKKGGTEPNRFISNPV